MSNTYSGVGGSGTLEVRTIDLATDLFGIDIIEVSNLTLTVGASPNIARITTGGGGGGVTTISMGTTGLTPAAATGGVVSVAGTLVAANGGTSFSTYTAGDMIYATGATALAKLGIGADTEVLTLAGGLPTWAAPTGGIGGTIAANQVAFGTAADTIGGSANLTWDDATGKFNILQQTSGAAGLTIQIDDNGAIASPDLVLFHNSNAPLAGDDLGHIHFQGNNSAATAKSYADIYTDILDPVDTQEAGRLLFRVAAATNTGNLTDMFSIRGDGNPAVVVNDSSRPDVDFRVESGLQNSAFFIDASADTATFNVPVTAVATSITAGSTVTGGTGVIATTGGVLASAGGVTATLGNIVATAGNITTTAGSISSATTVTGGTGVVATINDVTAAGGNVVAGVNLRATLGLEVGTYTQYTGFATLVDGAPMDTDTTKFFQIGTNFTNLLIPASFPGVEITVFCDIGPATLTAAFGATIQGGAFNGIVFQAGVPGAVTLYCTGVGADWFVVGSEGVLTYV